jgi:TRAP-type C4-dicarboxylate transport system substrate-binding protein
VRPTRGLQRVVAAAVGSLLLAACSGGSEGDKAGGGAAPLTMRMATMEGRGAPYADGVAEFARQVEELSHGRLRIKIVWGGAVEFFGAFGPGADQKVAGLVQNGKLDLGLIPARAWDELGVTSLQALQAPFLVSSEDLVDQIVQGKLAGKLLIGLDKAGVVGLALLPEGLRHPVGFARPLLRLDDFAGAKIRTLPSNASDRLLKALSAMPVDISSDAFSVAVANGEIAGAESGFAWAGTLPTPNTFTGNITFYPKVNALVVNGAAFGHLSDDRREILREAAAKALRYVVRNAPTDAERAAVYCGNGGAIAFASKRDLAALERAAFPASRALEADPQTKELIEQIRAMKAQVSVRPGASPAPCGSRAGRTVPASTVAGPSDFPEGVYRADLRPEDLIKKGLDSQTAYDIGGIRTLTFEKGRWRDHTQSAPSLPDCVGTYTVEARRIKLVLDAAQCGESARAVVMTARWKVGDGELTFFDIRVGRPLEWGSKPWKKID